MFDLGPAQAAELPALVALLPEAFPPVGQPAEIVVARDAGGVIGAAACAWLPGGFPILARVVAARRLQGVGRALIEASAGQARGETGALRAWSLLDDGSEGARFAAACGFTVARRLRYFGTDGARFAARMARLRARMASRLPPGAAIVPLRDAPREIVAALLAATFALLPQGAAQRLDPATPGSYHPDLSIVAMAGDALAGAMLCHARDGVIDVEVNAVVPAFRNGWANVLMLEHMARAGRAAGFDRFEFGCEPHVRDTLNLALRTDAAELPDRLTFVRRLA